MEEVKLYRTLDDIHLRKLNLKKEIKGNEREVKRLWDSLFHAKASKNENKLSRMLRLSTGAFDGALLGWKLYKKFKR